MPSELIPDQLRQLGRDLRICADDAHEGETPHVSIAWRFLRSQEDWKIGGEFVNLNSLSENPPADFIVGYHA